MNAFLGQLGERGPPPGVAQIETGLTAVTQIVVPQGEPLTLFGGPDGIVEVERKTGVELARSQLVASGIGYLTAGSGDNAPGPRVVAGPGRLSACSGRRATSGGGTDAADCLLFPRQAMLTFQVREHLNPGQK